MQQSAMFTIQATHVAQSILPASGCTGCATRTYSRCLRCDADVCGYCLVRHECEAVNAAG